MAPLGPLATLYNTVPFASLIVFLAVYNGMVANTNFSRFVRFNAMQAVMLDILLMWVWATCGCVHVWVGGCMRVCMCCVWWGG